MRPIAQELRRVLLLRECAHRQQTVSIDDVQRDRTPLREGANVISHDERRVFVGHDQTRPRSDPANDSARLISGARQKEVIADPARRCIARIRRHSFQYERVNAVVREWIIGANRFVDEQRKLPLIRHPDCMLETQVVAQAPGGLRPIEDELPTRVLFARHALHPQLVEIDAMSSAQQVPVRNEGVHGMMNAEW